MSEIMLAKSYDAAKLTFPVEVTIKLDGVAADFYKTPNGWVVQSRQGEPLPSAAYIVSWLNEHLDHAANNLHIIGELTVMGVSSFKEASGIIRRQVPDSRIVLNAYDIYTVGKERLPYLQRKDSLQAVLQSLYKQSLCTHDNVVYQQVKTVPLVGRAYNINELNKHFSSLPKLLEQSDSFEGFMVRNLGGKHSFYGVGKRSYGMMKYKPKPSLDLRVVGFEEATANKEMKFLDDTFQKGQGLLAVGRINVEYKGEVIGVGPGCLTHKERRDLWMRYKDNNFTLDVQPIAEVEYMLDKNYTALRQPVFKRWRLEKENPSYEH